MDPALLERIGLTKGESKVYLALLRLGQTTTGPIVKHAGVTTSKSYKILQRLEQKGLASHIYKGKILHFKAATPDKIRTLIAHKEMQIKEQRAQIEQLVPELLAYQQQITQAQEAEVFYGIAGLETLFDEQIRRLQKGGESFVIGIAPGKKYTPIVDKFFARLQAKRDHNKIITNLLYSDAARGTIPYQEKSRFCRIRYLPFTGLISINVYLDVTIIAIFAQEPILLKITSKEVASNFIEYFRLLWKQAEN